MTEYGFDPDGMRLLYAQGIEAFQARCGLAADVEIFHLGVLAGYDSFHDSAIFLTTLAFDIPSIAKFIAAKPWDLSSSCDQ